MKRDLERWRDKLTPEEERRIWSRMRGALRESGQREKPRSLVFWLRPAAVVAVAALAAVVIWQTDLLTPDRTAIGKLPERTAIAETPALQPMEPMAKATKTDLQQAEDVAEGKTSEAAQELVAEDAEEGKVRDSAQEALAKAQPPPTQSSRPRAARPGPVRTRN